MKYKVLYILAAIGLMSFSSYAQRGVRIGYIDTEYILQNVPDYQEATSQLETKLTKWKSEIEKRLADVETKKKALENEKVLLTKELYEERFEDISFEEAEVLDYQQKRFGPEGDMVIQRTQLIQPVQDQIFAAVKEIATNKKYDFVFDKNADFLMLYSAERFDISEQVLRIITRTNSREQAKTKKERKALEDETIVPKVERTKDDRAKALEERKAQREIQIEQYRLEREKAAAERKKKQLEAREARKQAALDRRQKTKKTDTESKTNEKEDAIKENDSTASKTTIKSPVKAKTKEEQAAEKRAKALKARQERQKKLEERKKKILEQRKKAKEERMRKNDSIRKSKANKEEDN